jgi:hypothetical protein
VLPDASLAQSIAARFDLAPSPPSREEPSLLVLPSA